MSLTDLQVVQRFYFGFLLLWWICLIMLNYVRFWIWIKVELQYDQKCQTESIRLTKSNKILGAALHPMLESHIVLLLSDGRLYFYHFG